MEYNRGAFLVFLLFFIFFSPAGSPPHLSSPNELLRLKEYLSTQRNETEILANSSWKHLSGKITGITPYPAQKEPNGNQFLPQEIIELANQVWHSEATITSETKENGEKLEERGLLGLNIVEPLSLDDGELVFYSNVSGIYEGQWRRPDEGKGLIPRNMTIADMFKPASTTMIYGRNVSIENLNYNEFGSIGVGHGNMTDEKGRTQLTLHEIEPETPQLNANVTLVTMNVALLNEDESGRFSFELQGFHFKSTGNLILTTSSLKYSGLQFLPHLILDEQYFNEAKGLMTSYLNTTLTAYEEEMDFATFQNAEMLADDCEYIVYGHVQSVPLSRHELHEIEDEFDNPLGRPISKVPELKLSTIMYSPDCAVSLKSEKIAGESYQSYWNNIRIAILCGALLLLAQMVLLAKQMKDTSTPSLILKVSFVSIAMMAVVDGSIWMASFASFFVEVLALPFMAVAFLSFALTSMFEMRYMVKIYQSQMLESVADARVRQTVNQNMVNGQGSLIARPDGSLVPPSRNSASPIESELPAPATAATITRPTAPEEDTSERAVAGMLYSRFYFALLIFIITSLIASTWAIHLRIIYEYVMVLGFCSLWVPQIYRNILRGYRKSFLWSFILGSSAIRLMPLLYVCLDTKNIVNHHYDPMLAIICVMWIAVQLLVLAAQNMFGARFFLPKGYLPVLYDYHPVLYQGDAEADLGIDVSSTGQQLPSPSKPPVRGSVTPEEDGPATQPLLASTEDQVLRPHVDCAICMMPVELIITPKNHAHTMSAALMLARRRYMVTPCQHVFHTECMERWMRTRLQCPICRNPLPSL